jgi:hypothetical protein
LQRNFLLKHVIGGDIKDGTEGARGPGRRCQQPLDVLEKKTQYCTFKDKALDCAVWETLFERGYIPAAR